MAKTVQPDHIRNGEWVQRSYLGDKYTWTISGVLWNNIKERCTKNGTTQRTEPTYLESVNSFVDFQDFTNWHIKQQGYGMGYDLDADILKDGIKEYSKEKCLLIPSALNRFIQGFPRDNGGYPKGVSRRGNKLLARCRFTNEEGITYDILNKLYELSEVNIAATDYLLAKNKCVSIWRDRLSSGKYLVDTRVVDFVNRLEFK